ncbi:nuclear factor of activated T-cells, cytoplasmic 4 isoform X1 [Pleurodeles waltl]|uniref:nuclear factor of activated T-cells, cytoplasmic 4 isoform X1 n=1 Tax=Pleurodeles waltl TaxID=8319 RepID=UPI0037094987
MGAAGCEDEELDFRLIFGEEEREAFPQETDLEADDRPPGKEVTGACQALPANLPIGIPCHGPVSRAGMHSPPPRPASDTDFNGTYESQPARCIHLGGSRFLECPSIQITTISPDNSDGGFEDGSQVNGWDGGERHGRDQLYLPLDPYGYRDGFFSPSPASSHSSWSFFSDASSCDSLHQMCDDVETELNDAASRFTLISPLGSPRGSPRPWSSTPAEEQWQLGLQAYNSSPSLSPRQSPCPSPREDIWLYPQASSSSSSRPTSPCGKRRYSSSEAQPSISPHPTSSASSPVISRRNSVTDEHPAAEQGSQKDLNSSKASAFEYQPTELDSIPQKARKTSTEQTLALMRQEEPICNGSAKTPSVMAVGNEDGSGLFSPVRKENMGMDYLAVPSPLAWSKARVGGHSPVFRSSALPPLDWPLLSQYEQYELKVEVQPRTHHRAHYETEGSRGAVKASPGGHPIVKVLGYNEKPLTLQMFIGTADERNLRPHAFYQVHRITGKMVATASYEAVAGSTKVLEMSVLPENGMTANIDCAGILKLRNSDIELRKGETDIGRKNTRVRLVFRVHIPQGNGKVVSLQTASIPIECSQRSAQELPQVESYNITACSVSGREELVLSGSNFLPESKVIFLEKGPDGKLIWEEEAEVNRLKSNERTMALEVPEYGNKKITRPVQAFFYVSNGRRKRSPTQCFKYLPVIFKDEPCPEIMLHRYPSPPDAQTEVFTELRTFSPEEGEMEVLPTHQTGLYHCLQPARPTGHCFPDMPMDQSPFYSASQDCPYGGGFSGFSPPQYDYPPSYFEIGGEILAHQNPLPIILGDPPPFHAAHSKPPPSPVPWSPQPPTTFQAGLFPYLQQSPPQPFADQACLQISPHPCHSVSSAGELCSPDFKGGQENRGHITHSEEAGSALSASQDAGPSIKAAEGTERSFPSIGLLYPPTEQPPAYRIPSPMFNSVAQSHPQPSPPSPTKSPLGQIPDAPQVEMAAPESSENPVKRLTELLTKEDQHCDAAQETPDKDVYSSPFHSIPIEGITLEEEGETTGQAFGTKQGGDTRMQIHHTTIYKPEDNNTVIIKWCSHI